MVVNNHLGSVNYQKVISLKSTFMYLILEGNYVLRKLWTYLSIPLWPFIWTLSAIVLLLPGRLFVFLGLFNVLTEIGQKQCFQEKKNYIYSPIAE